MPDSFPFYVFSGLLTKEHKKRIGAALWEFLWLIDKTTKEIQEEGGEMVGIVLGGKPIKLPEIADDLGGDKSTVSRNLEKLESNGYISVTRTPYGQILRVRNSKKWRELQKCNDAEEKPSAAPLQKCNSSADIDAKMQRELQKRNESCKNAFSNKDKAIDKASNEEKEVVVEDPLQNCNTDGQALESAAAGMPTPGHGTDPSASIDPDTDSGRTQISAADYRMQVTRKYLQRRARGTSLSNKDESSLNKIVGARVPLRTVLRGIDKAFDQFKPEHDRDEIRSLNYCVPFIFDLHVTEKAKGEQTGSLPESLRESAAASEETSRDTSQTEEDLLILMAQLRSGGGM